MSRATTNAPRYVRDIAHARAGDKGNTSNINVWVYDPADFAWLKKTLTPERIKREFPDLIKGKVVRYEMEKLGGLNFVMSDSLEGGRQCLAQSRLARQVVELPYPGAGAGSR